MPRISRRKIIQTVAFSATALTGVSNGAPGRDATAEMPLGVIRGLSDPDKELAKVRELGFTTCQLSGGDLSSGLAMRTKAALARHGIAPTSLICMGPGDYKWNFTEGPKTIGLVPRALRSERIARLKKGVGFCQEAGIPAVCAHFGFIPEDPNDPLYAEFIPAMQEIARYAKDRGILLYFETGQETPVTLLRAIEDIGTGNLGINYDTANLILYGKANPVDGLDVVGAYVRSLHAKDGRYPTNPRELGEETPIGEGKVNFPGIFRRLKELNFKGHITIEREISGPKQLEDIMKSKRFLENCIRTA
jgi:sugar phosphate isomerase/epimerase